MSSALPPPLFAESGPAAAGGACETLSEPLSQVMTLLGKRWTGVVWSTLMQGPVYFSDLKRGIPGINDRILNERLVELVDLGLATRTVVDDRPIRVRYELTEHGAAIRPALAELTRWAQDHLQKATSTGR
ncbi:winged helix-turn-helix transcriptional regulator [Actinoplanes auranticolor]|nr:helix-turn-helix domain-containing protein [Actinoplanes auranticolor]